MDLSRSQALLEQVFPDDVRYRDREYLEWLYLQGPSGRVISADRDDDVGRVGHYAVVPQRWLWDGRPALFALSLNTAVADRGRGRGLFTELATSAYITAAERGVEAIVGVANGNSTPGFVRKLAFCDLGPLPVLIAPARPMRARPTLLGVDQLVADPVLVAQAEHSDTRRQWDADELRWRLRAPNQGFVAVRVDDAVAIGCAARVAGVKFAVIAKVFSSPSTASVDAGAVVGSLCRALRAPLAVYAGVNPQFRLAGVPVPLRFRASPLNLIVRRLGDPSDERPVRPDCFEFLDFDAY